MTDSRSSKRKTVKKVSQKKKEIEAAKYNEPLGVMIEEALATPAPQRPSRLRRFFVHQFEATPSLAVFTALGAALFIGMAPIFVRLSEVPPIATAFYRFFFACPFLITWMMYDNVKDTEARVPTRPIEYALMILAGLFFALDLTCWHWSIELTSIVNSTMLNNMTPLFVAFFGWLVFGDRPSIWLIGGIFVAIIGALILASQNFDGNMGNTLGDLLGILSAVMFAGYILIQKYLRANFTTPTVMVWTSLSTMYFCALFAVFEAGPIAPITTVGWLNLIALAVVAHVVGQGLMAYAIRHISAGFTAMTMMIGPVAASLIAWPLFNESLGPIQFLGAGIMLLGIVVAQRSEKKS